MSPIYDPYNNFGWLLIGAIFIGCSLWTNHLALTRANVRDPAKQKEIKARLMRWVVYAVTAGILYIHVPGGVRFINTVIGPSKAEVELAQARIELTELKAQLASTKQVAVTIHTPVQDIPDYEFAFGTAASAASQETGRNGGKPTRSAGVDRERRLAGQCGYSEFRVGHGCRGRT